MEQSRNPQPSNPYPSAMVAMAYGRSSVTDDASVGRFSSMNVTGLGQGSIPKR